MASQRTSTDDPARESALVQLGGAIRRALRKLDRERERSARDLSLHPTDFACIGYLHGRGPVSPRDIIAYLGLTSGSGTALFDRLEAQGYIRRMPNPNDRRSILLELDTERAAQIIARYLEIERSFRSVSDGFTTTEIETVQKFLDKLAEA